MNKNFIQNKLIRLCGQPRTFDYLCKNMDGLDPVKLHETLNELKDRELIIKKDNLWAKKESDKNLTLGFVSPDPHLYLKKYMGYFEFLKTPHPLDFEWRNSTASLNYLTGLIQQMNSVTDSILYLGMPTLFATAFQKDLPHKVTLVERNKPIIEGLIKLVGNEDRFKVLDQDIFTVDPKRIGRHNCVVMDPPWYSPIFKQFMWLAGQAVEVGGIVGISMPPLNTKDDILVERLDWISYCSEQGLCLELLRPQQLHYAMPFFEFNALRAAGVQGFPPFWRKGDLAIFRKICDKKTSRPPIPPLSDEKWNEIEIEGVRIRVQKNGEESKTPLKVTHILKGDILPSVSKSDTRRNEANVWTSGNRIYKVSDTGTFWRLLGEVKEGKKFHNNNERIVSDFVEQVTSLEMREFNDYLEWLYHEMERQID